MDGPATIANSLVSGAWVEGNILQKQKMEPLLLAKAQALLFGLIGLILGIVYSFGGLVIDTLVTLGWLAARNFETSGLGYGTLLAFGALLMLPAGLGLLGFLIGLLEEGIYEWIRSRMQG